MRIHQLPPAIANQIAAGEVIERPASVVKELLENSLDAKADSITVEIGYGGLNQIKISDNGLGIVAEDLPLAVAAHATSKITTLNDLYAIDTMGFRGEALASIASVAKMVISSRPAQQEHGMMLRFHGSAYDLSPCARNVGTTIDVVDLFFNAPVRKRFLKNEKLEFQAIEMVVKRFALSAPHIALILKHNNKLMLSLPAAVNEQAKRTRMIKIFGNSFIKDAIYLDVERASMRLSGWISGPDFQRSQNDRQWVYINQRMVKDKLINHALKQAYDGLLHFGRFPACLLYLTIPTAELDVNVHPTKHEVRFQQPRLVHDFFTSQLAGALNTVTSQAKEYEYSVHPLSLESANIGEPYSPELEMTLNTPPLEANLAQNSNNFSGKIISSFRSYRAPERTQSRTSFIADEMPWTILNKNYILVLIQQQPYIVNILELQQQWLINQLKSIGFPLESRPLLVPITYSLPLLKNSIHPLLPVFELLGMQIELSKEDQLLIRSVPIMIPYLDIRLLLETATDLDCCSVENLLLLAIKSQHFEPKLLSSEEKMELNLFLITMSQENNHSTFYKPLSIEDCRMLFHV